MNLIAWFVNNPVKVMVGVLLSVLFGLLSLWAMPMQLTPEVELPIITIQTMWPGASPPEVERDIVQKQEEQLQSVEGLLKLSSESKDSMAEIKLEFPAGTDMDSALVKVSARLQQVRDYPEDVLEPTISLSDVNNFICWFILHPRLPDEQDFEAFLAHHPQLADAVAPARKSMNSGVMLYRLRKAAKEHPEVEELLPTYIPPEKLPRPDAYARVVNEYPELADVVASLQAEQNPLRAGQKLRELAAEHPELSELLPDEIDMSKLRRFAEDNVEARLERVDGVSTCNVVGGRQEEMQVIVDPQELASRRLTIADIRTALQAENKDTSAGDFWEGKRRWVVRTRGRYESPKQVSDTVLINQDGNPVYLRDVAKVRLGYAKPDSVVRRYGEEMIAINASRTTGSNVLDVVNGLKLVAEELNAGILADKKLYLALVYDETDYIRSSIDLVQGNIIIGGLLTVIVLMVFLRDVRSTIIIGLSIPVSLVSSFLVLNALGCTINVISLAGLAFAVGMLVDNSVVTLENVYRHYQLGASARVAAVRGISEVWGAVVASTLTTLAVFIPVVLIEDQAGQLFRDIALAISAAVGLSLIVSVTVVPVFASKLLKAVRQAEASDHRRKSARLSAVTGFFDRSGRYFVEAMVGLNRVLQSSKLASLATVFLFAAGSILLSWLLLPKVEYLPNGNRNLILGIVVPPPGYNVDKMMEMGTTVEERLRPYWNADPGSPEAAAVKYPLIDDFFFVARGRQVFIGLRSYEPLRAAELIPLVEEATSGMAGCFAIPMQASLFERGLTAGRSIDVEIIGPDLDTLINLGRMGFGKVNEVLPAVTDRKGIVYTTKVLPQPSLDKASPEVHLHRRPEQATGMAMNSRELGYAVDALVDGAYAGDYFTGGDTIDLKIVGKNRFVKRTQDLNSLPIATPTGDVVVLDSLANIDYDSGPEQINHRERERAITLQVTPPPQVPLEDAMERIQAEVVPALLADPALKGVYQVNLAGTADKLRDTWKSMRGFLLLAVIITYLLMAALFESWLHPLVVMFSVPLGAVGGFVGLWLLNRFVLQPLDVVTMLGFIILIGTVVNNAILIVHQSLNHIREDGMTPSEGVLESVRNRMRPIFMTTITTLLGLLPLVVSPGAGSELYRGLGSVLLGGLLISTLFTLILVPTLFSLMMDLTAHLQRIGLVSAETAPLGVSHPRLPDAAPVLDRQDVPLGAYPERHTFEAATAGGIDLASEDQDITGGRSPHTGDGNGHNRPTGFEIVRPQRSDN